MHTSNEPELGDTAETPSPVPNLPTIAEPTSNRIHVDYAALSHQGRVRTSNQDRYSFARFGRSLHTILTNLSDHKLPRWLDDVGYAMLVADGMGGAAAGDLAAEHAVLTLIDLFMQTPDWIMSEQPGDVVRVLVRMAERYEQIDQALRQRGEFDRKLTGMGTTMTLAASLGQRLIIAHVGDSRAYLLRDDAFTPLTKDHTIAQALVERGLFQHVDQVAAHLRHTLSRCLGGSGDSCEPDVHQTTLADGDQLLLCSDGLTNMVDDGRIAAILKAAPTAHAAAQALVDAALAAGGKDNVTVVLARYRFLSP